MKTIISALHFRWQTITDCLDVAAVDLQLDGVEMSWHESFARPHCTLEDLALLPSLSKSRDMLLSAHVWDNIAEADGTQAENSLLRWLELCKKTGVRNLVAHGGTYANQAEGIARTRRVLERVLPAFERAQVVLNLENHYDYDYRGCRELFSRPWEFLEVLNLDSPSLKFCFDTGHANMTRNTAELLDTLAPWLNYVHLADNQGVDDDHAAYGRGTIDWSDVFRRLSTVRTNNFLCVEFPVYEDKDPFRACMTDIRLLWPGARKTQ